MADKVKKKKGKAGKAFAAIFAFLAGFLLAIIIEIGALFGVGLAVYNTKVDKLLGYMGLDNSNDEYVTTDDKTTLGHLIKDVKNNLLSDGNGKFAPLAIAGKSFEEISEILPLVKTKILDGLVYPFTDKYIEIDKQALETCELNQIVQVLNDELLKLKTAPLFKLLGNESLTGESANPVIKSILMGAEASYATVIGTPVPLAEGETATFKLPVMYDYYTFGENGKYNRVAAVDANDAYPDVNLNPDDWLYKVDTNKYCQYFVPCRVTANGIEEAQYKVAEIEHRVGSGSNEKIYKMQVIELGEGTDFIAVKPDSSGKFVLNYAEIYAAANAAPTASDSSDRFINYSYYEPYARNYYKVVEEKDVSGVTGAHIQTISGLNYFMNNSGEMIQLDALTLKDLLEDPYTPLGSVPVTEILGDDETVTKIFGQTSVGDLLRGNADLDTLIEETELSAFVGNIKPTDRLMTYIVYKLTDMKKVGDFTYVGTYDKDGAKEQKATIILNDSGYIEKVLSEGGTELEGEKVKSISTLSNKITVGVLMDVEIDDPIMLYLAYGVNGVSAAPANSQLVYEDENNDEQTFSYTYVGTYNDGESKRPCYISLNEDGKVDKVYCKEGERRAVMIAGTKVNDITVRMANIKKDMTLGEFISIDSSSSMILQSLKDSTIDDLSDSIDGLLISQIFEPDKIETNLILKQLKNVKVSELPEAIDDLLTQRIYSKEVYGLLEDTDPMEVVAFHDGWTYYVTRKIGSTSEYELTGVTLTSATDMQAGVAYYTYGDEEGVSGAKLKVVGHDGTGYNTGWLYYEKLQSGDFVLIHNDDGDDVRGNMTTDEAAHAFESGKYYSYGEARGMWRLVLYKKVALGSDPNDKQLVEKAYTINNFNNMVSVCAQNVYAATLEDLQKAEIINPSLNLNKQFAGYVLKDMTLEELITYVVSNATDLS